MKNKRNKKLLSSMLVAATLLSTTVSVNNKVVNAAVSFKDEDRKNLNGLKRLVYEINCESDGINAIEIEELYDAYNQLVKSVNKILEHRPNNLKSKLRDSMMEEKVVENIDNYKQIDDYKNKSRDDILKDVRSMNDLLKMFDKVKGGWFTVWDSNAKKSVNILKNKVVSLINRLENNENNKFFNALDLDRCFEKLGGTKKDIDDYRKNVDQISNYLGKSHKQYPSNLKEDFEQIDKDAKRSAGGKPQYLPVLERILKVHSSRNISKQDNNGIFFAQGYNFICKKFLDLYGKENIDKETEAKIYYVYRMFMDKIIVECASKLYNDACNSKHVYYKRLLENFTNENKDFLSESEKTGLENLSNFMIFANCGFLVLNEDTWSEIFCKFVYKKNIKNKNEKILQEFVNETFIKLINITRKLKQGEKIIDGINLNDFNKDDEFKDIFGSFMQRLIESW